MGARILVIDHDHSSTMALVDSLRGFGYDTITLPPDRLATTWSLLSQEPDFVVVDVPRHLGQEALHTVREICAIHHVPVIFATERLFPAVPGTTLPVIHLVRPLAPESLRGIIDAFLTMRQEGQLCRNESERLRHTVESLEEAQTLAGVGNWEEHLLTKEIHLSPECLRIHEQPLLHPPLSVAPLLGGVAPDDRERVEQLLNEAREGGQSYETEYRLLRPPQPARIIQQRVVVHRDTEGRPFRLVSMVRDITEQSRIEDELRKSEQRASQLLRERDFLLENTRDVLYYIDENWNIYYVSPAVTQITGYTVEEWHGPFVAHLVDTPNNRRAIAETMEILRTGRTYPPSDIDIRHKNGSVLVAEVNEQPIIAHDRVVGIVGVARDVTEKRLAENRLRQATAVFDSMLEAVVITDSTWHITAVNRSFVEITGYGESEVLGKTPDFLSSGPDDDLVRDKVWEDASQNDRWAGEVWHRRKSGEAFPAWMAISTIRDAAGRITNYVSLTSDLSRIRESEEKLDRLAHYDPLTRLPNRLLFNSRLSHAIRAAERRNQEIAILFIDLDHFKTINDTLGHPVGDRLLQEVAYRLSASLRREDTVAHLGGDEFVILLEDLKGLQHVVDIAQKVLGGLRRPYGLNGEQAVITASMGISIYPRDGDDVTRLLRNADAAMYRAKELGRAQFQFYTIELTTKAIERMALIGALRNALEKGEFVLHYQPQLSLETGFVSGVEALIRWRHPARGLIQPSAFISLEEETGMIVTVGEWVLRAACTQAKEWEAVGAGHVRMAINLSALQLTRDAGLSERVAKILEETGADPQQLELEITESAIMRNPTEAVMMLKELKALGIRIAIDDFGSGYSSMNYLKTFAVDSLKVDASFIHDLPADSNDRAIVRAIIALGHGLQMNVIAEGVETPEQQAFLHDNGCDEIQGFLYSPPLPEQQCREMLLRSIH